MHLLIEMKFKSLICLSQLRCKQKSSFSYRHTIFPLGKCFVNYC